VDHSLLHGRLAAALACVLLGRAASAEVSMRPRGALVVNLGYNSGTFLPGPYGYYALPRSLSRPQFFLAPSNTVLGFIVDGVKLGEGPVVLSAGLDLTLRSPSPLQTGSALAPQFYDAYVRMEGDRLRLTLGQFPDVVVPVVPETFNLFPVGYLPGSLGFARPQLRADARFPLGEANQLLVQASAATPVQTFDVGGTRIGRQAGVPDGQLRLAFARGQAKQPWERPFELGVGGHLGRRLVSDMMGMDEQRFTTWSAGVDLRLHLAGTNIRGRLWRGAVLGDYTAGAFQTVSLLARRPVRASGGWAAVHQAVGERWKIGAGYGRDDPHDADLDPGDRTLNQAAFLSVSLALAANTGVGLELTRWGTDYRALPSSWLWRIDTVSFVRF